MNIVNLILNTDSYKASHWLQYPPKTETVVSYIESRGGEYDKTVFFGLQMFLKEYMTTPVTMEDIDEAEAWLTAHGEPFNREGWEHIVNEHGGRLPIRIKAVPEGTVVPTHNVLVTVENTDPKAFWLTSYVETALLRGVWYPTTVATVSWSIKQVIREYLQRTADEEAMGGLPFKLHDFGARGVSSFESAGIGGAAHLVNFMGTDTITGARYAQKYYNETDMLAFSVPAAEHSSITTWGKTGEGEAYKNMLEQFGGKFPIISVVSDSYDIYNAVEKHWGKDLKEQVLGSGSMLVIRPDSGDPATVVAKIALLLDTTFGSTVNTKGFKVLNGVRIIQGDGINEESIRAILAKLVGYGFSADNVVFGMGGALLQHANRDTQNFAMKASAALVDGKWVDVFKDPVTSKMKWSKAGRLMLYRNEETDELFTDRVDAGDGRQGHGRAGRPMLKVVFEDGILTRETTFTKVRERADRG